MRAKKEETEESILNYGIRLLARQDYSEKTLRDKFKQRTSNLIWINAAISRLKEYNYVDDKRFAERHYVSCVEFKCYGQQRIYSEFVKKGLSEYLDEVSAEKEVDWTTVCLKHLDSEVDYLKLSDKERNKVIRRLMGKGFSYEEIKKAFGKNREE